MHEPYPLFTLLGALPVLIHTPAASGYTLRCYQDVHAEDATGGDGDDERPVFLGRDGAVFAFRSTAVLVEFLGSGEAHDLAELPDWDPPDWNEVTLVADIALTYVAHEQYPVCRLDGVDGVFQRRPSFDTVDEALETIVVVRELAGWAGLEPVREALAPGSAFGRFVADLQWGYYTKAGMQHRPLLDDHDHGALAATWSEVVAQVVPVVRFRD